MNQLQLDALIAFTKAQSNLAVVEFGSAPGGIHAASQVAKRAEQALRDAFSPPPEAAR